MDRKPQVFPSNTANTNSKYVDMSAGEKPQTNVEYEVNKKAATSEVYVNAMSPDNKPNTGYDYVAQNGGVESMKKRTEEALAMRDKFGVVKYPELAEKPKVRMTENSTNYTESKLDEQIRLRDEQLKKNQDMISNYQKQSEQIMNRPKGSYTETQNGFVRNDSVVPPSKPPVNPPPTNYGELPSNINPYIQELSQPQYNAAFDLIPLPSGGKLYRNRKANIKVAYMTTSDENVLTSPNLLQSGEFLEILINRKILEPTLRYRDLLIGDRNAIMIWLRATAFGEMYPVTLLDEKNEPFETEINLNNLKTKKLNIEPDQEGFFTFVLPKSKAPIKFRLLTVGDIDDIERLVSKEKENNIPVDNGNIYSMARSIVEANGSRDREYIKEFVASLLIPDARALRAYIDGIDCGIDLNITVGTPGGGSIDTFLPLTFKFFWPDSSI